MKTKQIAILLAIVSVLAGILVMPARASAPDSAREYYDGIISYKLAQSGQNSIQSWINSSLSSQAGTSSEWYILSLSQMDNYDFSQYEKSLGSYLKNNNVSSATSRQKYALTLMSVGSGSQYIYSTLYDSIGQMGIMSWIYGLHLINNGYTGSYSSKDIRSTLISLQKSDGGWAINGNYGDVDVTSMCIQALSPYYNKDSKTKTAINSAISFLSGQQKSSGGFSSYGVENCESTVQVLVALSSLGIDCESDSRFIKEGKDLIDVIGEYKNTSGAFSHISGGAANENATVQVLYGMVSYMRLKASKSPLYILDKRNPSILSIPETTKAYSATTEVPNTTVTTETKETKYIVSSDTTKKSSETTSAITEKVHTSAETSKEDLKTTNIESTDLLSDTILTDTTIISVEPIDSTIYIETTAESTTYETSTEEVDYGQTSNNLTMKIVSIICICTISSVIILLVIFFIKKRKK